MLHARADAIEQRWLHHAGILLLELGADRAAVAPIFSTPLEANLKLIEYNIQPSLGGASATMLPWGSMMALGSQDAAADASQLYVGQGALRATASLAFSQTQTQDGGVGGVGATYSSDRKSVV